MININFNKQLKYYSKESIQKRERNKINKKECECGGTYSNNSYSSHFKTNKHIKYIQSLITQ